MNLDVHVVATLQALVDRARRDPSRDVAVLAAVASAARASPSATNPRLASLADRELRRVTGAPSPGR